MAHPLQGETGQTPERRLEEALSIAKELVEEAGFQLTEKERSFAEKMTDTTFCTPRQLFWLRDLKEKYLL